MWLTWNVIGWNPKPYPCLWMGEIPDEPTSAYRRIVFQRHKLTEADQSEIVGRTDVLNYLAKKYPYIDPNPVDDSHSVVIVSEVIDKPATGT